MSDPQPDDATLRDVAHDLRNRAESLLERWAPDAKRSEDRKVMIGDAGVMEWAASVIEKEIEQREQ